MPEIRHTELKSQISIQQSMLFAPARICPGAYLAHSILEECLVYLVKVPK